MIEYKPDTRQSDCPHELSRLALNVAIDLESDLENLQGSLSILVQCLRGVLNKTWGKDSYWLTSEWTDSKRYKMCVKKLYEICARNTRYEKILGNTQRRDELQEIIKDILLDIEEFVTQIGQIHKDSPQEDLDALKEFCLAVNKNCQGPSSVIKY